MPVFVIGFATVIVRCGPRVQPAVACLTFLTSSQGILIQVSKSAGKFDYSVTTANCMVEVTKCLISLATLAKQHLTADSVPAPLRTAEARGPSPRSHKRG